MAWEVQQAGSRCLPPTRDKLPNKLIVKPPTRVEDGHRGLPHMTFTPFTAVRNQ